MPNEIEKVFNEAPSFLVKYGLFVVVGIIIFTTILLTINGIDIFK